MSLYFYLFISYLTVCHRFVFLFCGQPTQYGFSPNSLLLLFRELWKVTSCVMTDDIPLSLQETITVR